MASYLLRTEPVVGVPVIRLEAQTGAGLTYYANCREPQFTTLPFVKRLEEVGIAPSSMGRTGSAPDNEALLAESFVSTLKAELVDCHSIREAARVTFFFE